MNEKTKNLINSNSVVNLPNVKILSDDKIIKEILNCHEHPQFLGETITDSDYSRCVDLCGNAGKVLRIEIDDEYYVNDRLLMPGFWCVGSIPDCNTKLTYLVATLTGYICVSKYPNLFDNTGRNIVACNVSRHFDKNNVLWDYKFNEPVVPSKVILQDEDERLQDGTFRFRCKFNGKDKKNNKYKQHPFNRFIPISDVCVKDVVSAHPDVGVKFNSNLESFVCDCGDYNVTRLKNKKNKTDECTACFDKPGLFSFPCFGLTSTHKQMEKFKYPCPNVTFDEKLNCAYIKYSLMDANFVCNFRRAPNCTSIY